VLEAVVSLGPVTIVVDTVSTGCSGEGDYGRQSFTGIQSGESNGHIPHE
jgi:hypothetical protein